MSVNIIENENLEVGKTIIHGDQKFKIMKNIWTGPFSEVMVIRDLHSGRRFAMKVEKATDPHKSVLKLDVFVLREFKDRKVPGIPELIAQGRTSRLKYVIMQLLGPDLCKLRRSLPKKKFSLTTALRLSAQTLSRIESLHDTGWLSRDIKASNFTIGLKDNIGIVYMLDFGFARRFRDYDGNLYQPRTAAALLGSIHYASLAAHAFNDQCRRDDVESWFYMACEFIKGTLPWFGADPRKEYLLIGEWKRYARKSGRFELLADVPEEFDQVLNIIDNTKYYERPDYHTILRLLDESFTRLNLDRSTPFEWQKDPFLIRKASVIGDQGQSCFVSHRLRQLTNDDDEVVYLPS